MKQMLVVLSVLVMAVSSFANPFASSQGWSTMSDDASAVVAAFSNVQGTITGAITDILPMLIGIFVVFLVIRFIPKLVKRFAKG